MLYLSLRVACLTALSCLAFAVQAKDPPPSVATYEVEEVPLSQVSADLATGKTTSVAVTQAYVDRIQAYNDALNAVIRIAPDAVKQAAASDRRRKEGKPLGPMDGVPILLKDNIDATGMPTTAGSFALISNLPAKDSEVTRRLRAAGAVILGKTNTQQWAGLRTAASFNGSTVGGGPHNPYDLKRSAAGSSNGSGIAAAVSFSAAAVGTDTTGSVISPASYNGVVGMRPTVALISRRGIVPVSSTQDTAGPMSRTVMDNAMLLSVIAGSDAADPATKEADAHKVDYANGLSSSSLKGVRLGVLRGTRGYSEETRPALEAALKVMAAQGAELVEIPAGFLEDLSQEQRLIMVYDVKQDMAAYLRDAPAAVKSRTLADLIEFNRKDPRENLHPQDLFEAAQATTGRDNPEYLKTVAYAKRRAGEDGYLKAMRQYRVSALVGVSRGPAEIIPPDGTMGGHPAMAAKKGSQPPSLSGLAALAGYPNLTVPMGLVSGLPVGLSFIGEPWSERKLLAYGYCYEQAAHARVPPMVAAASAAAN
jgi:amidase